MFTTEIIMSRQFPFITHFSKLLHSGQPLPAYDWNSSLGMSLLTAYNDYAFSPFSLLLYIFPVKMIPYAWTFVQAAKIGITAAGAYIYCRQYVKYDRSAFICGVLYAFSGYQIFNLVYPFIDSVALFPLTLYAFDQLMEKRRPGWFAVMLALNGFRHVYFLWQVCVFVLIYFLVRVLSKTYPKFNVKLFLQLAFETIIGVGMTAVILLPVAELLRGNPRTGDLIFDSNLMAYSNDGAVLKTIQSMFFPPDVCARGWYFTDRKLSLDPPLLYIPLFLITGVAAAMKQDIKAWYSRLIMTCAVIAAVPLLNSVFSMMNASYYARWMYMPLLVMIMMTGLFIDDMRAVELKKEIKLTGWIVLFLIIWGVYCAVSRSDFSFTAWVISAAVALLSIILLYFLVYPNDNLKFVSDKNLTGLACAVCFLSMMPYINSMVQDDYFCFISNETNDMWNEGHYIDTGDTEFFRVSSPRLNDGLMYEMPTVDSFNSSYTSEEAAFYSRVGLERLQNPLLTEKDYPLYTFLSVKYGLYYRGTSLGGDEVMPENVYIDYPGFENYKLYNKFNLFENENFIPMGFTYDYYLNIDDFKPFTQEYDDDEDSGNTLAMVDEIIDGSGNQGEMFRYSDPYNNEKRLLKAIWLTDEQIGKYGSILEPLPEELAKDLSYETYCKDCRERAESACYEFEPDGKGFSARTSLAKDSLVFFSIPYDKGFTAYVDGQETELEKVFDGLCAVFVPEGDHSIRFDYETVGLKEGTVVTLVCTSLLLIYIIACAAVSIKGRKTKDSENAEK